MFFRKFRALNVAIIVVLAMGLSSCTTKLTSKPLRKGRPITGVVYHLPATRLKVDVTYEIVSCNPLSINVVDGTITTDVVPDRSLSATYVVDHRQMRSWLKVIETAQIQLQSGMLKKITYKAEDKTRDIIVAAAGVAVKLGLAAGGLPLPPKLLMLLMDKPAAKDNCNEKTREALLKKGDIKNEIMDLREKRYALHGRWKKAIEEFLKDLEDDKSKKIDRINKHLTKVSKRLDEASKQLATLRASRLTVTTSAYVIPKEKHLREDLLVQYVPSVFLKWFRQDAVANLEEIEPHTNLTLTFTEIVEDAISSTITKDDENVEGVVYRIPAPVRITVKHTKSKVVIGREDHIPILQFGRLAKFDVKNSIFQHNVHEIAFDSAGNLILFDFADKKARAQEAIGTIGDVVTQAGSFEQQKLKQRAQLERMRKELAEAEKARIKAEKELEEARAAAQQD